MPDVDRTESNAADRVDTTPTKNRLTHPGEKVYACPECDSAPVYLRVRENRSVGELPFACHTCSTDFELPVCRPPKKNGHCGGTVGKLLETSPEEVGL